MKRAINKYSRDFIAIVVLFVIALGVGGFILSKQRLYLPSWVPVVGSSFVDRKLELTTGQAITPGQGQEIAIAGVKVGEIGAVDLQDGRAILTMKLRKKYSKIYRDANALLRPKTGLKDMTVQLDPGNPSAGVAPKSWAVPVSQTLPDINADEVLAALDGDTRDYLQLLLAGAGEGLRGNARNLSNTFRRFEPVSRDLRAINEKLAERRTNIRRAVHNFQLLTGAVAGKDKDLTQLVDASNAVFQSFTNQDAALRASLKLLPGTLSSARTNLARTDRLAKTLGPSLQALRPAARALGPSLRQVRPFVRDATPVIRDQLRPFTRASLPTVKILRPAARDLASVLPDLDSSLKTVNELLNELAYNPPGDAEEGYLFWASWANHAGASVFASQDAHGPIRHGVLLLSCSSITTLQAIKAANAQLGVLISLLNPVSQSDACPGQAGAGSGTPPGPGTPGGATGTSNPTGGLIPPTSGPAAGGGNPGATAGAPSLPSLPVGAGR